MTDAAQRVADLIASAVEYDLNSRPSARTAPTGSDEPLPLIRAVPLPDPYPVHDLGLEIAAVVEALQGVVQSPMAMSAGSVLATITLAAQAHINVELPIGHGAVRPVSSFFVTVGRSGERKSATDDWPTKGIKAHESALRRQYDADFVNYRDAANTYEAARKAILAGKATPTEKRVDFAALGPTGF